jgi:hypothetical protein
LLCGGILVATFFAEEKFMSTLHFNIEGGLADLIVHLICMEPCAIPLICFVAVGLGGMGETLQKACAAEEFEKNRKLNAELELKL